MKKLLFLILILCSSVSGAQIVGPASGLSSGGQISGCNAITAIANVVSGTFACNPASVVNGTVSTGGTSTFTAQ